METEERRGEGRRGKVKSGGMTAPVRVRWLWKSYTDGVINASYSYIMLAIGVRVHFLFITTNHFVKCTV